MRHTRHDKQSDVSHWLKRKHWKISWFGGFLRDQQTNVYSSGSQQYQHNKHDGIFPQTIFLSTNIKYTHKNTHTHTHTTRQAINNQQQQSRHWCVLVSMYSDCSRTQFPCTMAHRAQSVSFVCMCESIWVCVCMYVCVNSCVFDSDTVTVIQCVHGFKSRQRHKFQCKYNVNCVATWRAATTHRAAIEPSHYITNTKIIEIDFVVALGQERKKDDLFSHRYRRQRPNTNLRCRSSLIFSSKNSSVSFPYRKENEANIWKNSTS